MEYEQIIEYLPGLYRHALQAIPYDDVEDFWQDYQIAVIRANYGGRSSVKTWLDSIMDRRVAQFYRQRYRYDATIERYIDSSAVPVAWQNTEAIEIMELLSRLRPKAQRDMRHYYLDGWTCIEIAEHYHDNYEAIWSRIRRAVIELREMINTPKKKMP